MKSPATLQWLTTRWSLPASSAGIVESLLQAWERGSTAVEIAGPGDSWGDAAGSAVDNPDSPIVVVPHDSRLFLQSRRHFAAEQTIASRLITIASRKLPAEDIPAGLKELYPLAAGDDRQVAATRLASERQLAIITGGPGTGKTYVLARILALLASPALPAGGIRVAAPTGKAADRMKSAIRSAVATLPDSFRAKAALLERIAATTLHSLVGYNPDTGRCRFDKSNPLPCKVLIIDECSMVDVFLWQALLAALPEDARLILLGDPNQLESVGSGNVFQEIVREAGRSGSPLSHTHVHLTEARRFRERPDILSFAHAIEDSDAAAALALLAKSKSGDGSCGLVWIDVPAATPSPERFPQPVLKAMEAVATAPTPESALEALAAICILTAQNDFHAGSGAMSNAIGQFLARQCAGDLRNHPVIINRNDPETGLRNGSVGIIHRSSDGHRKAWFPAASGILTPVPVPSLPDFSPAWAITIHRSQGSEYQDVVVVLPRQDSPLATRELLYTAITRARNTVYVLGPASTVAKAVATRSDRVTLLAAALQSQAD